jgi:hypothetical protein
MIFIKCINKGEQWQRINHLSNNKSKRQKTQQKIIMTEFQGLEIKFLIILFKKDNRSIRFSFFRKSSLFL